MKESMKTVLETTQWDETLPPLVDGIPPQTFDALWRDYDPRKEPLDVEVLKEWEEDGVVMKVLRYRIGIFKGQKAMMAAVYGYPKGEGDRSQGSRLRQGYGGQAGVRGQGTGRKMPGLVQIHGGGQYAHANACLTNAKRGYATISISWAGRINAPDYEVNPDIVKLFWDGKTDDPDYKLTTDWGALDGYHAPFRYVHGFSVSAPHEHTLDPVASPRNDSWFLAAMGARRALTFLEQQPEVDGDKLGVYGHSMGGKLTVMTAGADERVKAAAPSCGGISHRGDKDPLIRDMICDDAYLERITCPIMFLSPSNDFHGSIEDLQTSLKEIKSTEWRAACAPHHQHQDTKDYEVATQIWFDQVLQNCFVTPETPRTELTLRSSTGVPGLEILPDTTREILSVDVFLSRDAAKMPADRFWHHVPTKKGDGKWTTSLELYGLEKPLWVYANVRYKLDEPITGAGYYYGIYTTDSYVLSSEMHMISPDDLEGAGVRSVLEVAGQIEDFSKDWRKEWFIYDNDPANWRLTTRKLGDDLYAAPDGAKLAFSVRSEQPNQLILLMDDKAAIVELAGENEWLDVALTPAEFKGIGGESRLDWKHITLLQFTDTVTLQLGENDEKAEPLVVGKTWEGAAPELRDMRWVAGHEAKRDT